MSARARRRTHTGPSVSKAVRAPERQAAARGLFLLLTIAFTVKFAVMLQLKNHVLTQPDAGLDTTTYVSLAQQVLRGDLALGPGLYFVSPLYIYFLALILWLTSAFTVVRTVQMTLGTAGVWLVYLAAREWFGHRAGLLAAGMLTLCGLCTFYEALLIQSALDPFLTAAGLAGLAIGLNRGDARCCALSGLAFGLQSLNRPNIAAVVVSMIVLAGVARRVRLAAWVALGFVIVLLPVSLRNEAQAGTWSPMSSHGGLNFYIGNNPVATGTYREVRGIRPNLEGQISDARTVAEKATGHALTDDEVSGYFYSVAWQWIRESPASAVRLFARKLRLTFSGAAPWLNYSYGFFARDEGTILRGLFVGPWLLLPLGLVGLAYGMPTVKRREYLIWTSFVPLYGLSVALFFVSDRYTLPLLVPLAIGGGAALSVFIDAAVAGRWRMAGSLLGATGALLVLVNLPLKVDDGVAEERTRMAERLVTLGRYAEAEEWAKRAEERSEQPGILHVRLAEGLLARGRPDDAINHLKKALESDPGKPEIEYMLGETYLAEGRPYDAAECFRHAVAGGFRVEQASFDLARSLAATGDRDGAVRVLQGVNAVAVNDAERALGMGELGMQLRDAVVAAEFFRRAVVLSPESGDPYFDLAAAELAQGHAGEAKTQLQNALRRDPGNQRFREMERMLK